MTFTTTKLVGSRTLVGGTDVLGNTGQAILDSSQWDEVKAHQEFDLAADDFDRAVEEFLAPITEAAEKMHLKVNKPEDPASFVVLHEPVESVAGDPGVVVKLGHDAIVLRLIEQDPATPRLVWVGDNLEILEAPAAAAPVGGGSNVVLPEDAGLGFTD